MINTDKEFLCGIAMYGLGVISASIPHIALFNPWVGGLTMAIGGMMVIMSFFLEQRRRK